MDRIGRVDALAAPPTARSPPSRAGALLGRPERAEGEDLGVKEDPGHGRRRPGSWLARSAKSALATGPGSRAVNRMARGERHQARPASIGGPGRRVSTAFGAVNQIVHVRRYPEGRGVVMGVAKKAKRDAKAVKGKAKKDASKAKHKGKKVKKAAKH